MSGGLNGLFNMMLGKVTPIPPAVADKTKPLPGRDGREQR